MPSLGLRGKVLLASTVVALAAVLVSAATAALFFYERQLHAQLSRTQAIADALAIQLERILALEIPLHELQGFDEQCDEAMARHGGLSFAVVVDAAGSQLFRSARASTPAPALPVMPAAPAPVAGLHSVDERVELALAPVRAGEGGLVATVVVGLPREAVAAERDALLWRMLGMGVAALLATLAGLYLLLARVLVRPLGQVLRAVERMRAGEAGVEVPTHGPRDDEIALLGDGFNGLVQAVTARERELLAARDAAEAANRAKSEFLAVMSHELRTPLNGVLGMAEVLARSPLNARQQGQLSQLRSSGRLLAELITDLLDLSSIEAGRLRVQAEPFDLHQCVRETVELYRDAAQSRGLVLSLSIDAAVPATVVGDALRTRQILGNLLGNALKFTERGSVSVSVAAAGERVRFAVADTGIGIEPELMPHIYEAFRQGDASQTRRFGGTGLGLTIAQQLCTALKGRIDASSQPGRGSTFWFELPLPPAPQPVSVASGV